MSNNIKKLKRALETQRQQRDAADFKRIIETESARQDLEREHPVSCGLIPLVEYHEPNWRYGK